MSERELKAEISQQAKIIGESIDAHDKLVMEKRGLEVENTRLQGEVEGLDGKLDFRMDENAQIASHARCLSDEVAKLRSRIAATILEIEGAALLGDGELARSASLKNTAKGIRSALGDDEPIAVVDGWTYGDMDNDGRALAFTRYVPYDDSHPIIPVTCIIIPRSTADDAEKGEGNEAE